MNIAISIVKENTFTVWTDSIGKSFEYDDTKSANIARGKMVKYLKSQDGVNVFFASREESAKCTEEIAH